jgi:serine/threonine protein kinase
MHDLGLVHSDLNPSNIMDGNNPIIIDFDSCKPEGQKLGKEELPDTRWNRKGTRSEAMISTASQSCENP